MSQCTVYFSKSNRNLLICSENTENRNPRNCWVCQVAVVWRIYLSEMSWIILVRSCFYSPTIRSLKRWTYLIAVLKRIPATPLCWVWGVGLSTNDVQSEICAVLMQVCSGKTFFLPFFSQLNVLQSLMIRLVGLVIPNNCFLKCGKTS